MARTVQAETSGSWFSRGWMSARGLVLGLTVLTIVTLAVVFAFFSSERYVSESPRFRFRIAEMAGDDDNLRVMGANRAAAEEIRAVFRHDQGRSLYTMPIEERRAQIMNVKWVREAAIIRRWPDGIDVMVEERRPAAFVHLTRRKSDAPKLMLIDEAGELLPIPDKNNYRLPVLLGLSEEQKPEARADRVRLMNYFFREISGLPVKVAELDVADPRNLKCRVSLDGRSLLLLMGADGFAANVGRFIDHWPEIQQRLPDARVLDMRVPEHITAVTDEDGERAEPNKAKPERDKR